MSKNTLEEFKFMIGRAIDREELDDIRQMILEESDLSSNEKENLFTYLQTVSKTLPDLPANVSR